MDGLFDPWDVRSWIREGCSCCSVATLGMRLGNWVWGTERETTQSEILDFLLHEVHEFLLAWLVIWQRVHDEVGGWVLP